MAIHPTLPTGNPGTDESYSVTGSWTGSVSGLNPVSGNTTLSGNLSGPWFIEEQFMDLKYARVPRINRRLIEDTNVSLSGAGVVSGNVINTMLICRVSVGTVTYKSTDYYASASFQQPQKFALYPEMYDYKNNAYGTVGDFSGGAYWQPLGPRGYIYTGQKFHNRRLWQAGDVVSSTYTTGYNFQIWPTYTSVDGSISGRTNAGELFNDHTAWMANKWQDVREIHKDVSSVFPVYELPGRYSYNQEEFVVNQKLINMLDTFGIKVAVGGLWQENAPSHSNVAMPTKPHAGYDYTRHDYT